MSDEQNAKDPKALNPTEQRMATENLKKLILLYSIPTIISMFINALYNVVDRYWVGKIPGVGKDALAGVGLTMPIMTVSLGLSMLIGIGAAARISISLGRRDQAEAERILGNSVTLSVVVAVFMCAAGLLFKIPMLRAIGASDVTLPFADEYITIILLGSVFQVMSFALNHPIRAAGNPKRFAQTQLIGAITNIILDPLFIVVLDMGVKGAAIATIIGMMASTTWVFLYYRSKASTLRIHMKNLKLQKAVVFSIFSIGFSPCLMQIAAAVVGFISNRGLKYYGDMALGNGDVAIGAMAVISGIFALVLMPVFGINQGAQPIIGFNYGANNYERVKEAYKWSAIYGVIVSGVLSLLVMLFAAPLVSMFNDDPTLVATGTFAMRIMISTGILVGFQAPSVNFFTAIGRAKLSVFLSLLRQVTVLIPCYVILPIFFGLNGMWYAVPIADTVAMVITVYYIIREFKMLKISMAQAEADARLAGA